MYNFFGGKQGVIDKQNKAFRDKYNVLDLNKNYFDHYKATKTNNMGAFYEKIPELVNLSLNDNNGEIVDGNQKEGFSEKTIDEIEVNTSLEVDELKEVEMIGDLGDIEQKYGHWEKYQIGDDTNPYNKSYMMWMPDNLDPTKECKLIVTLHGQNGSPNEWIDSEHWDNSLGRNFNMTEVWEDAQENCQFVVVAPYYQVWNDSKLEDTEGFANGEMQTEFLNSIKNEVNISNDVKDRIILGGSLGGNYVLTNYEDLAPYYGTILSIGDCVDSGPIPVCAQNIADVMGKVENPTELWLAYGTNEIQGNQRTTKYLTGAPNVHTFTIQDGWHNHLTWGSYAKYFIEQKWGK